MTESAACESLVFRSLPGGCVVECADARKEITEHSPLSKKHTAELIRFAVPKGVKADPQRIADKIREWWAANAAVTGKHEGARWERNEPGWESAQIDGREVSVCKEADGRWASYVDDTDTEDTAPRFATAGEAKQDVERRATPGAVKNPLRASV